MADVVAGQGAVMGRLRGLAGGCQAVFDAHVVRAVEALAREVHLLPASDRGRFARPGGLFGQCVECAGGCMEAAAARFGRAVGGPAWPDRALRLPVAAGLAGLACSLLRPLGRVVVHDGAGRSWPKYERSLARWLEELGLDHYEVDWAAGPPTIARTAAAAVLGRLYPSDTLGWLGEGAPDLVRELYAVSLALPEGRDTRLGDLVASVRRGLAMAHDAPSVPFPLPAGEDAASAGGAPDAPTHRLQG